MNLEHVIQSELSQKEKNKYVLMNIYGIQKNGTDKPIWMEGMKTLDDLGGQDAGGMEGRLKREEMYIYLQLIHIVVEQKLTHCKAIILQQKINFKKSI